MNGELTDVWRDEEFVRRCRAYMRWQESIGEHPEWPTLSMLDHNFDAEQAASLLTTPKTTN